MLIEANAKVNLALNIVEVRKDLYHNLDMVNLPIKLHDLIDISVLPYKGNDTYITCDDATLPVDEYNLACVAVKKMRAFYGFTQQFRIHIHKAIPASAGLGGGSSDAAMVMKGIVKLLNIKARDSDLLSIAQSIGADVPFFLYNKPARVTGIGEVITPIKVKNKYDILLIKPQGGCSTKTVFESSRKEEWGKANIGAIIKELEDGNDDNLGSLISNDLEKAAFKIVPEIESVKKVLLNDNFKIVGMTGSGSTVFAIFKNHKEAKKMYDKYRKVYEFVELTSTLETK